MIFESLWPLAFVLAVPIIIVLYLLVPKGKEYKISSNLLWKKLYQNQQSKTFLEKFIHNLLMYLQIVIILLLVLALMSPYIRKGGTGSGNVVYVLDTSGSMQHENADGETRLAQAVAEIKSDIASSDNGKFSIITNDGTGHVAIAEAIQQDFAVIGAELKIETNEWNVFLNERKAGNYDMSRNGWLADFNDPINMLEMWTTNSGNNDVQFGR